MNPSKNHTMTRKSLISSLKTRFCQQTFRESRTVSSLRTLRSVRVSNSSSWLPLRDFAASRQILSFALTTNQAPASNKSKIHTMTTEARQFPWINGFCQSRLQSSHADFHDVTVAVTQRPSSTFRADSWSLSCPRTRDISRRIGASRRSFPAYLVDGSFSQLL